MEDITDKMVIDCLQFIQSLGGAVSRYSFDRYVTKNIKVKESWNSIPKKLLDDGLINIIREEKEIKITLTKIGLDKITAK